ncbi:epimerase [Paenibacillus baekrokdamisoli]|uniref:Epimerase n=1 Tax=Paenibacillus baekrokdamisoli TaxID=1712516 RepID=A0A3G9J6S1_9BACL|nr:sugar phosphate isomerase/epimerase family protein [Paenibacillus baekrokdamisoli]MBB3067784.1 sugar phosphate isomerase/epimerase [Paenibacillus baekrokdamisoli]BBH19034.1 epimerase [Paenibacillus baekrokdamisoli]
MSKQLYELKNDKIRSAFLSLKKNQPERFEKRLNLSWSNWGFGMESLEDSAKRLQNAGIEFIELHGNHYGPDLGYHARETLEILGAHGITVAGVCGMFSKDNDLSSNRAIHRQAAIDYLKREIEFTSSVGGSYLLVVPGAVGRPDKYDDMELERSVNMLRSVADLFVKHGVRAAVEPIRSAETSYVHTILDAQAYIRAVDHPGVQHINADLYHMQLEESHIGEALLASGEQLLNLHVADSNRCALGEGSLDLDTVIMALYLLGFNREGRYVTPEPLGPGGDPYPAMFGKPDRVKLDQMVMQTASYFRERESILLG